MPVKFLPLFVKAISRKPNPSYKARNVKYLSGELVQFCSS